MATTTLRPNGDVSSTHWVKSTGAAFWSLLDDSPNDDATYARLPEESGSDHTDAFVVNMTTFSLSLYAQIRSVTPKCRARKLNSFQDVLRLRIDGDSVYSQPDLSTGFVTFTGTTRTKQPNGTDWTQAAIDALKLKVEGIAGATFLDYDEYRVSELFADVVTNEAPTPTVTLPVEGSTVTDTNQPTTAADYSDTENDAQERYQVKVVTEATYTDPGFDINTSGSVWDTGPVIAALTSLQIGVPLANGTYRVYWRFADAGSNGRFGPWDFNTFTIAIDPPAAPVTASVDDDAAAKIAVTVTGRDNMLSFNQSSVETDLTGLEARTNCTVVRSIAHSSHGVASLEATATAAGDIVVQTDDATSFRLPVVVGQTYYVYGEAKTPTAARDIDIGLTFLNAAGTEVLTNLGDDSTAGTTAFTPRDNSIVAPVDAATAYLRFRAKALGAAENAYFDKLSVVPGAATAWGRGGFVDTTGALTGTTAELQRSVDGGVTWQAVRGAGALALTNPLQQVVFDDHDAPRGVSIVYRSRVTGTVNGSPFTGDWSAASAPVELSMSGFHLKHPDHPEWNTTLDVAPTFRSAFREPQETIDILGSDEPLHATDGVKGEDLRVPLWTKSKTMYDAVRRLLRTGDVLLLQDNLGQQWWVKVQSGASFDRMHVADTTGDYETGHVWSVDLQFVTAKEPS